MVNMRKISVNVSREEGEHCDVRQARGTVTTVAVAASNGSQLKEYDPYDEVSVDKPTTYMETLFNFVKQNMGMGILALPNTFYHSGYLLGSVCLVAMATLSVYCKHLQLRVNYALSKKKRVPCLSYEDTISSACEEGPHFFQTLGPYLRFLTNLATVASQLGTGIIYIVFISSSVKKVCDEYLEPADGWLYSAAILPSLIILNYVRSFKYLAPFSALSNGVAFASYGIILYYMFVGIRPLGERRAVGELAHIPLALGSMMFVFEPAPIVIPMTKEMMRPREFASKFGVMNVGTVIINMVYLPFGFVGYLAYGSQALGSVTLNLPLHEVPATIARVSQCAVIFLSHAIQNYVLFDIVWHQWLSKKLKDGRWRLAAEYLFRTAIVVFEFVMAVALPNLDLLISLVGALTVPLIGFVTPVVIHASHHWSRGAHKKAALASQCCVFSLVAIFASVIGVATSLIEIVNTFK